MSPFRIVLLIAVAALAWAAPGAQAASPLLGQWSLDGSYEDGANDGTPDSSGNGLHLKAASGSIHLGPPALFGTAATLPTNTSPLQVTSPVLAPPQVTLMAWIKQTGNPGTLKYIAGRGDDAFPTCSGSTYAIYSGYPGKPGLHFYVRTVGGGSLLSDAPVDATVFDGRWHLLAGTFDGSAARFYVDGVQIGATMSGTAPLNYALGGGSTFYVDGYPVDQCNLSPNADDWPGPIDEVRVYDRALSASELTRLAASTGPAAPALITDESLMLPPPPSAPAVSDQQAAKAAAPVQAESIAKAAKGLIGVSKAPPAPPLQEALESAQSQVANALRTATGASQISAAETLKDLTAKELKKLKASEPVQEQLGKTKYGISVEIPAGAPGEIMEAIVSVMLQRKDGAKARTQTITLAPAVGIAAQVGAGKATVELQVSVDGRATAAMANDDIAKAAFSVQAAKLDSLADLSAEKQQRLQMYTDAYSKSMEAISNLMKKISDTEGTIVGNLKGGETKSERKEDKDLKAKADKIDKDIRALEKARDEAAQKAASAMQDATTQMVTGILGGLSQINSAAAGAGATVPTGTPNLGVPVADFLKAMPASSSALKGCTKCQYAISSEAASN